MFIENDENSFATSNIFCDSEEEQIVQINLFCEINEDPETPSLFFADDSESFPEISNCNLKTELDITSTMSDTGRNVEENKNKEHTITNSCVEGAAVGVAKNALQYAVKTGGRASNIVNVFDKTVRSSRGNPKWFARVDMPHTNTPFHHINVNKAVTGVKDPHIPISATGAKVAGVAGGILEGVQKAAPILVAASVVYDAYQVGCSVKDDIEHHSSRNTVKTVATKTATVAGCLGGASAGAAIGTAIFPGVGTLIGGLLGSIIGGGASGVGSEIASEVVLDAVNYDVDDMTCKKCGKWFEYRRYQEMYNELCPECRNNQKQLSKL